MKNNNQSIFHRVLIPLMVLILAEILIFTGAVHISRVTQNVTRNAMEVADGKLTSRKNYVESTMINNWMNVGSTVSDMNEMMSDMLAGGLITKTEIGQPGDACDAFLIQASQRLLRMMRANRVTGGFILLNTGSLNNHEVNEEGERIVPGVYMRDLDPLSAFSGKNTDILLERAPAAVVKSTGIATDTSWSSAFRFTDETEYYSLFAQPYQTAFETAGKYEWIDLGYWSAPYSLDGEGRYAISYSVPLILEDGTVYGVLGVDIMLDYLAAMMPSAELSDHNDGTYFLAEADKEDPNRFTEIFDTGDNTWAGDEAATYAGNSGSGKTYVDLDQSIYYHKTLDLGIYSSNVPYEDTNWVLGFAIPWKTIEENANGIRMAFGIAGLIVIICAVLGCIAIAYGIRRPVHRLAEEIKQADSRSRLKLEPTGIREVDEMARAIEQLSADVIDSGKKFSKIIRMASEDLGGFQIDQVNKTLFITDGFFQVFGMEGIANRSLTIDEFLGIMQNLSMKIVDKESDAEGTIYEIDKEGKKRYIRLRQTAEQGIRYGLAEDVTQSLLRQRLLLFERDHDALTGLLNRKAFSVQISEHLENYGRTYRCGALLMLDLDNLKTVNDTYGHESGDAYIRMAAKTISDTSKENAICSRISGDEFNVFYYGNNREEIERRIEAMREAFRSAVIKVGDGEKRQVRISAGIAWYPEDARSYEELQRFADSALYVAKKNHKGEFETFDLEGYVGEDEIRARREALVELLDQKRFHYVYQPIVSAKSGDIFAFEALLRSDMEEFASPLQILETARAEGKLGQVENATVPCAIRTFFEHRKEKRFDGKVKLFFNTISNQILTPETKAEILETCGSHLSNLVMELTEEEPIDYADWEEKTGWLLKEGAIALDDYGTGYNSEKSLLAISPQYIKVDIAIVRNIHNSPDKQTIMEYIVNFAHERGKYIIAEGVEEEAEAKTCIAMGADFLQGYYIGKPMEVPGRI